MGETYRVHEWLIMVDIRIHMVVFFLLDILPLIPDVWMNF